ncbi:hypothetical protein R3P38DRAFT_3181889 [Favolaschia claudopus]|uniref:Hydrophobin n=1 Tax=Favolaschia claudopus TaxID=2862362 RepID=A0AAW0CJU5_9AGAR
MSLNSFIVLTLILAPSESLTSSSLGSCHTKPPPPRSPPASPSNAATESHPHKTRTLQTLLGLLGVVVDPSSQVGLTCSPVITGGGCSGVAVNCDQVLAGGLLATNFVSLLNLARSLEPNRLCYIVNFSPDVQSPDVNLFDFIEHLSPYSSFSSRATQSSHRRVEQSLRDLDTTLDT